MSKSNFEKVYTHILNDEQKQTDLMEIIKDPWAKKIIREEKSKNRFIKLFEEYVENTDISKNKDIDDCIKMIGISNEQREEIWEKKKS